MVAGADDEGGQAREPLQVFFDHQDLRIQVKMAGDIEQVPDNNDHVVIRRRRHEPVKLAHVVVQVPDGQYFHPHGMEQVSCRKAGILEE